MSFDYRPGLTVRFPRWEDTFVTAVYSHRKGLNGVAAECDQSPSELGKRLSNHLEPKPGEQKEPRPLRSVDIIGILDSTDDFTPIFWLIERYLRDPETKRKEAIHQLAQLAPFFIELAEQAGVPLPKKGKGG